MPRPAAVGLDSAWSPSRHESAPPESELPVATESHLRKTLSDQGAAKFASQAGGDPESAGFDAMWKQLGAQHELEMSQMRAEVLRLHSLLVDSSCHAVEMIAVQSSQTAADRDCAGALAKCGLPIVRDGEGAVQLDPGRVDDGDGVAPRTPMSRSETPMSTRFRAASREFKHIATSEAMRIATRRGISPRYARHVEFMIGTLILFDVIFTFAQLEVAGYESGVALGLEEAGRYPNLGALFVIVPNLVQFIFVAELSLRMYTLGKHFFYRAGEWQKFNIFDFFVVLLSSLDVWVFAPLSSGTEVNLTIIRLFRLFKSARMLNAARTLELFTKLRVLALTMLASLGALFWAVVLIGIVMLIGALFMCQSLNSTFGSLSLDDDTKAWVYRYYGTPSRALWSFFELTFSGGWPNYARPLVEDVSAWFAVFFFFYIITVVFAIFRVVTALFIKETLGTAARDVELAITESMREKSQYAGKLRKFFEAADSSEDGYLTREEFQHFISDDRVKSYLAHLEINVSDSEQLFALMVRDQDKISVDDFANGAVKLKGSARSSDVIALMRDSRALTRKLEEIEAALTRLRADGEASPKR